MSGTCERVIGGNPCIKAAEGYFIVEQVSGSRRVRLCADCLGVLVDKARFNPDQFRVYTDEGKVIE